MGPLVVVNGDGGRSISARKMEVLIAALLIKSGLVVTVDQLKTEIWGNSAPRRAVASLQVYVSQLRKLLARPGEPDSPIVTHPAGYFLHVGPDEVDLHTFTRLLRDGREHARLRQHEDARAAFGAALDLYRGPALFDLYGGPIVNQFAAWLEEARLECIEFLNESQLALGCHREMVENPYSFAVRHPCRETLCRQLMLALYRSECQADALKVCQGARMILRSELGVELCRRLRVDATVLSVALPTLARALHASESDLQWFSSGYMLVLAAAMLPAGLLGDRFGRMDLALLVSGGIAVAGLVLTVLFLPRTNAPTAAPPPRRDKEPDALATR